MPRIPQDIRRIDAERVLAKRVVENYVGENGDLHDRDTDTDKMVLVWRAEGVKPKSQGIQGASPSHSGGTDYSQ